MQKSVNQKFESNPTDHSFSTCEDRLTIQKVCEGNASAFAELFRKYYEALYRFATRFVSDTQVAENIVQDVFVKIWESRASLKIHSNVRAYLYMATRNHALNVIKREKRTVSIDGYTNFESSLKSPDEQTIDKELHKAVHKAIAQLPERGRRVYEMHKFDGLSYSEIAEIQQVSINTVKTQMQRAMKSLHKQLSYLLTSIIKILIS